MFTEAEQRQVNDPEDYIKESIMKDINSLIPDIYQLIQSQGGWFDAVSEGFSRDVAGRLRAQLSDKRTHASLRLSKMGPSCPRALWYSINRPGMAEALPPWAIIKYSYGHILEALVVTLAKASGHEVTGEQDELVLDGIVGHRDCVVDGFVVDVKSSSSIGFQKFKDRTIAQRDSFGYLEQLDGYVLASSNDVKVRHKDAGYLLAIDKTLGHLVLYKHEVTHEREATLRARIQEYKQIVSSPNPPSCRCKVVPHGASGNLQLDFKAGYSPYKHCCHPTLRTFLYSGGPVYLTKVVRKPDVPEVTFSRRSGTVEAGQYLVRDVDLPMVGSSIQIPHSANDNGVGDRAQQEVA